MKYIVCFLLLMGLHVAMSCDVTTAQQKSGKVPLPAPQTTMQYVESFEHENVSWKTGSGKWEFDLQAGNVTQVDRGADSSVMVLADKKYSDVDVSVDFRPISGKENASGGIVFRVRDLKNYYVVSANLLKEDVAFYKVKDGHRQLICRVDAKPLKIGEYHSIRVVAVGGRVQAYLNDMLLVDHHDPSFNMGYVGLLTKSDAVTEFDNLKIIGESVC